MKRILIIEDDLVLRLTIKSVLKQRGYDLIEAADGAEGSRLALSQKPDLVLSDICMPEADGLSVLSNLRAHPETKSIPCILMTGFFDVNAMRDALRNGADAYLIKPFPFDQLFKTVEECLAKNTHPNN